MKVLELKANLKSKVVNVYSIAGNDEFLINVAIDTLKNSLVDGFEEFNYINVDGAELKENDYKNLLNTLPFGAGNRLVIITNINTAGVNAVTVFSKLDFYNVVVAIVDGEKQIGEKINCDHLDNYDLKKWLTNYFNKNELKFDAKLFDYIIDISNGDLGYISNELNKVVGYCEKGETVTTDIIKLLFTKNESYFVYNLTSAIDNKDKATAVKILNSLQENASVAEIFAYMGPYFRKMFYCAINQQNNDELPQILKTKPYAIQKSKEAVNKNGKSFYINLFNKYVSLDYELKSGKISAINAIYSLIV